MSKEKLMKIIPKYKLFEYLLKSINKNLDKRKKLKIIDVGCGKKPYEKEIKSVLHKKAEEIEYIGIDLYTKESDLKIDLNTENLPFKKGSIDIIICTEVLEHLYNPFHILAEIKRILKNEGLLLITSPFLHPIHEKKHDYFRYTHHFYRNQFKNQFILEEVISNTAFSFLLYVIQYYISIPLNYIFKTKNKFIGLLQLPLDKLNLILFEKRFITYSLYVNIGYLIKF